MARMQVVVLGLWLAGCGVATVGGGDDPGRGKSDTGWLGGDSFEIEGVLRGKVRHAATGDFEKLATDRALQEQLIDTQVKFGKATMHHLGYVLNQFAYQIRKITVQTEGELVTLQFEAVVDLVRRSEGDKASTLESLEPRTFDVGLPLDPITAYDTAGMACFADDCEYPIEESNYFYCFAPDKKGCDQKLPLSRSTIELTAVYPVSGPVYPEYDQLLTKLPDGGRGFKAALLPTLGDNEDHYTFDPLKKSLEEDLQLKGTLSEDKTYYRYVWQRGGVEMIIDLYDPAVLGDGGAFVDAFHQALSGYQLIVYGGHSQYGTRPLLSATSWYSKTYQIVMMESCRSYAYYARQVFRAKATAADPSGFALADVLSTGEPSTFYNIMEGIPPVLSSLMEGIEAANGSDRKAAPSWQAIIRRINDATWSDAMRGVAGVRTNAWQP